MSNYCYASTWNWRVHFIHCETGKSKNVTATIDQPLHKIHGVVTEPLFLTTSAFTQIPLLKVCVCKKLLYIDQHNDTDDLMEDHSNCALAIGILQSALH